MIWWRINRSK